MAASSRELQLILEIQNNTARELKKLQEGIGGVESQSKSLKNLVKGGLIIGLANEIKGILTLPLQLASNMEETQNKFEAVMGSMTGQAEEFTNRLAESVGRNKTDLKDGLAAFQSFAVGMGFTKEQAFQVSTALQAASVDFASFNNVSDGEAQQRFIAAMSGSSEVMDKFGINIKAAALDQQLLEMGINKTTAEATEQEKALARMQIILKTMTQQGAMGDAIKTADSYANQLKRLKANIKTLVAEFGVRLIPIVNSVVKAINSALQMFRGFDMGIIRNNGIVRVLISTFTALYQTFTEKLRPQLIALFNNFKQLFPAIKSVAKLVGGFLLKAFAFLFDAGMRISGMLLGVVNKLIDFGQIMVGAGKIVYAFVKDALKNFMEFGKNIKKIFTAIGKALTGNFEGAKDELNNLVSGALSNTVAEFADFKQLTQREMGAASDAVLEVGDSWDQISSQISSGGGTQGMNIEFENIAGTLADEIPASAKKTGEATDKLKDKLQEYSKESEKFADTVKSAFNEVAKKIQSINSEMEGLLVDRSKNDLAMRENFADEYVKQEQKVADLQQQINKESDNTRRGILEQELARQQEALNQHKTIELAYQREIDDARRRASLTDFERTVEDLEKKKTLMNIEFSEKFELLQKELTAEVAKFNKINEINKAALKQKDKFLADSELLTVDSINREIEKYNQLAQAIQRARSGQTTAGVTASAATVSRSQQDVGSININISDSIVSDEEGAKKIGQIAAEEIAKQIKLNQSFSFA